MRAFVRLTSQYNRIDRPKTNNTDNRATVSRISINSHTSHITDQQQTYISPLSTHCHDSRVSVESPRCCRMWHTRRTRRYDDRNNDTGDNKHSENYNSIKGSKRIDNEGNYMSVRHTSKTDHHHSSGTTSMELQQPQQKQQHEEVHDHHHGIRRQQQQLQQRL
jgi:hypothetical protein